MAKKGAMSREETKAIAEDGDVEMIERVAARIEQQLGARQMKIIEGKKHTGGIRAESEALAWLQIQCHVQGIMPPRPLVGAISYALAPLNYMDQETLKNVDARIRKAQDIGQYLAENPDAGVREAARALGVEPSTISRRKRD